jgi:3-dehydroquinate dehydratase type I
MNDRICVSLPITSGKVKENIKVIKEALKYEPFFIELRLDYLDDLDAINQNLLKPLLEIIGPKCSSIFTFRSFREGGKIQIEEGKRLQIVKDLISFKPNYIDIEMNTKDNILSQIINSAVNEEINLIFSHHDFEKTPSLDESQTHINMFINRLKDDFNLNSNFIENSIYKIIFTAEKYTDNLIPLNLCASLSDKFKIISFCMGSKGIFSRIFCTKFGSFFTYGSLEKETAPGQIKIEKIRNYHKLLFKS